MSFVYNKRKTDWMNGSAAAIDFDTDDMRVLLVMTNTTCDTEDDVVTFAGFTTIDEMDGANYVADGMALANEAVNEDLPNNRAEFDADDLTWSALGVGTRNVAAAVLYKFITNQAASHPVAFIDTGGFPCAAAFCHTFSAPSAERAEERLSI